MITTSITRPEASTAVQLNLQGSGKWKVSQSTTAVSRERERNGTDEYPAARYPHYLPVWDNEKGKTYEKLEPFEHVDRAKHADPTFPNLLKGATFQGISASIGMQVDGIQLSELDDKGKDELALLVAQKKVVVFRNQNLAELPIDQALEFGKSFGRLLVHPTSGAPAGFPEVHVVHRSAEDTSFQNCLTARTNSITWHSDSSFEIQPPGTTILIALEVPNVGGDTLFVNQVKAYERLSPTFQQMLSGLEAVHSGFEQAQSSLARGGVNRRQPISTVHPVVRTHPVTGEKALYVNSDYTRHIVGLKKEESDCFLRFLFDHQALSQDIQCRVRYEPGTVVVWDNRVTSHSSLVDWEVSTRRHLARIAPQAERPTA